MLVSMAKKRFTEIWVKKCWNILSKVNNTYCYMSTTFWDCRCFTSLKMFKITNINSNFILYPLFLLFHLFRVYTACHISTNVWDWRCLMKVLKCLLSNKSLIFNLWVIKAIHKSPNANLNRCALVHMLPKNLELIIVVWRIWETMIWNCFLLMTFS